MTDPRLLNAADLATYLSTTERHVRELVYRRAIPFVKIGRALRFDRVVIDRWIDGNATAAG